jgi:hypothetical protein
MAIDFPNSPTAGDLYTAGGKTWQWNSTYWSAYGTSPVLRTSDTAPVSPNNGDLSYETDTTRFFTYIEIFWVEIGNATDIAGALQPGQVTALSAVTSLTSDDVFPVVDNPASATASNKITYGNLVTNMSNSLFPAWTNYTPTFSQTVTITKTVLYAKYMQVGKLVFYSGSMAATSSGTSGGIIQIGLPIAPLITSNAIIGTFLFTGGPSHYLNKVGSATVASSSTFGAFVQDGVSNWFGANPSFQILSGDYVYWQTVYEAA